MLGDVLLITENHTKAAQGILEELAQVKGKKVVLAVSGESGSGKTEIAHEVARLLKQRGTPAKIMHSDDYYRIHPAERTPWRQQHGIEMIGIDEYDWPAINRNLEEFRADQDRISMPCIDLLTDQEDQLITSFQGLRYLIFEGLFAIQAAADLRVLIDLTYHETKRAQVLRGKEPVNDFRWQVLEREHQVVESLRPKADLLVRKDFSVGPA